jgi:cell filamentation protein
VVDRYQVAGDQGQFEPGSGGRVLANQLGIVDSEEMDDVELYLLSRLYEALLGDDFPDRALTVADLQRWHRRWPGNIYGWAGEERSVNMAKDGFQFAAAAQISRLLADFERDCLSRFTPCGHMDESMLIEAIAITHVEFILMHPFREGNGRLGRLLADVMTLQARRSPLDYRVWDDNREAYFSAIQVGMGCDYEPMKRMVGQALAI